MTNKSGERPLPHDWERVPGAALLRCRECERYWAPDESLAQQGRCFRSPKPEHLGRTEATDGR